MDAPKRMNKGITKAKKEKRQAEAAIRQQKHETLTPIQKLAKLDAKLGEGIGAKKERTRLEALL